MSRSHISYLVLFAALLVAFLFAGTNELYASSGKKGDKDFSLWVSSFKKEALRKGVSKKTLDKAFKGVKPIARIIELDRKQPEGKMSFAQYKKRVITKGRIKKGRKLYKKHKNLLDEIAYKYGVPAPYIVALWGIETSYGTNTGGFGVIESLATLAYDGRRGSFFRKELITALKIIDKKHITLDKMKGSWAGAMGQNQFMPSSFMAFAVDGNNDGKRDIWTSLPDVFSSTANYLKKSGWKEDERWGREVNLPPNFSKRLIGKKSAKYLKEWDRLGLRTASGESIPVVPGMKAYVVAPDGLGGAAFLVYHNFDVIMKWNKSHYFALSVGILADKIAAVKTEKAAKTKTTLPVNKDKVINKGNK